MTFPISLDEVSLTMSQLDWRITPQKNETLKAHQNRRYYFEVYSSSPLAHLYDLKHVINRRLNFTSFIS
jgi:hypothetical protein